MARRALNSKRKNDRLLASRVNRQLIGFVVLLFVFAILCYVTFVIYDEGTLFKSPYQPAVSSEAGNNTGMTTVSIVYKNSSKV